MDQALRRRIARYERQYDSLADMAFEALVNGSYLNMTRAEIHALEERAEVLDRQITLMRAEAHA